jgi:hypothetical protein
VTVRTDDVLSRTHQRRTRPVSMCTKSDAS